MIRFNLFTKTFLLILLIIVFFSALIYTFSVPLIKETVYEIEENAGKTILDNVYELVHKISMDLEAYRESAYAAHKRELRNIIEIVESYINDVRADVKSGRLSEKEAKKSILDKLRTFKYGRNDYIWVSDYNSVLISHPDPRLYGRDFSGIRDVRGNL
ncbi:MAG TPA: histidine kinase, partial [Nitrospirae bacterium]|nr:histidine kinase [Nitrospirota bacterium]